MKAFLFICIIVQAHALCQRRCRTHNPATCAQGYECLVSNTTGKPECFAKDQWASWSGWSPCVTPCENGTRTRTRECGNPPHTNCPGISSETELCDAPYCYFFNTKGLNWYEASTACKEMNGYLAVINDADEQNWLATNFGQLFHWIGLINTDGNYIWENTSMEPSYTAWNQGFPSGQSQICGWIGTNNNHWGELNCYVFGYSICEFDRK